MITEFEKYLKEDHRDRIKVTGGRVSDVTLQRWDEAYFRVIPPKGVDISVAEANDIYKYIWSLEKKPLSNIVEFGLESRNLKFLYQPALTSQEIAEGCIRPDNVVGSHAVYHISKGGMNSSKGKDYKCGKHSHIYRPYLIDSSGRATWGNISIDPKGGTYRIAIPEDFYKYAVYPIKANDDWGTTSVGGSTTNINQDQIWSNSHVSPADISDADSISVYARRNPTCGFKGILVDNGSSIVSNGIGAGTNLPTATPPGVWTTSTFGTKPSVSASTAYYISLIIETSTVLIYYDTSVGASHYDSTNSYASPVNPGYVTNFDRLISLYCSYTPSGGVARRVFII